MAALLFCADLARAFDAAVLLRWVELENFVVAALMLRRGWRTFSRLPVPGGLGIGWGIHWCRAGLSWCLC